MILGAVAAMVALASLGLAAGGAGLVSVVLAALGYLLAVGADLSARRARHSVRNYSRPWSAAVLRLAVFCAALGAAWLAAEGLASS